MGPFSIKKDDTQPSLAATLSSAAATLVGATVRLYMRNEVTDVAKVNGGVCVIVAAAARTIRYDWAAGDTDTVGHYRSEIVVTFADATQETFPANGCFYIEVCPR